MTNYKQVDFIQEYKLPSTRGGAGRGQGRKKGDETVRIRVLVSKLDEIKALLNGELVNSYQIEELQKELTAAKAEIEFLKTKFLISFPRNVM